MREAARNATAPGTEQLVEIAYASDPVEAEMIRGLLGSGEIPSLLEPTGLNVSRIGGVGGLGSAYGSRGSQRVTVHSDRAEEARALLAEALAAGEAEAEIANAGYLEDARGRKPRGYGIGGAWARIYLWSIGAMAVAFGIFLLLRSG
jgi:hypothetical protein